MRSLCSTTGAPRGSASACTSARAASPTTASRCSAWPSKARAAGAQIEEGVEVTGFDLDGVGRGHARADRDRADRGRSRSWSPSGRGSRGCGRCSACPTAWTCAGRDGTGRRPRCGRTGTSRRARSTSTRRCSSPTTGALPPVLHVDSRRAAARRRRAAGHRRAVGHLLQAGPSTACRAAPRRCRWARSSSSTPTRPARVEPGFPDLWCAALSHCMARFEGCRARYRQARSGGVGAFTADNFPVFDHMRPNVFVAADSNHGYKMIAVGREIARVLRRRALRRCCTRSATSASPPATCTRSRTAPTPGARAPVPSHVVVGAGVNGLSVASRLAERGADVVVLDKGRVGGGATGSAGGIVRNYYRVGGDHRAGPAVDRDLRGRARGLRLPSGRLPGGGPRAAGRRPGGDPRAARAGGYASELVVGAERCREYLTWTWPDWDAPVEAILHERRGGWADAMQTVRHLAEQARGAGAEIREGVEVVGFELGESGVEAIATSAGRLECETVVVAPGPWIARVWSMLGLPPHVEVGGASPGRWCRTGRRRRASSRSAASDSAAGGPRRAGRPPRPARAAPLRSRWPRLVPGAWGIYFRMGRRTPSPAAGCRSL